MMKRKSSEEPAAAEEEKKKKKKMAPALLLAESSVKGDTAAKSKTKKRPQPDDREPTASHEKVLDWKIHPHSLVEPVVDGGPPFF